MNPEMLLRPSSQLGWMEMQKIQWNQIFFFFFLRKWLEQFCTCNYTSFFNVFSVTYISSQKAVQQRWPQYNSRSRVVIMKCVPLHTTDVISDTARYSHELGSAWTSSLSFVWSRLKKCGTSNNWQVFILSSKPLQSKRPGPHKFHLLLSLNLMTPPGP